MPHFHHDRPLESPLGKKLIAAGYRSLWEYANLNGFTHLDRLRGDVGFPSLTERGFFDFVVACARIDDRWEEAFLISAAHHLNNARIRYAQSAPSENWMVIQPCGSLASEFQGLIPWSQRAAFGLRDYLLSHRELFAESFSYDSAWLVELVRQAKAA